MWEGEKTFGVAVRLKEQERGMDEHQEDSGRYSRRPAHSAR